MIRAAPTKPLRQPCVQQMNLSKLEKIVKSDTRYYKQGTDDDNSCSFTTARLKERIQAKFDKIYAQKRAALLVERLNNLPISKASKYAKTGDEYHLRLEISYGHPVNNRDPQRLVDMNSIILQCRCSTFTPYRTSTQWSYLIAGGLWSWSFPYSQNATE